jgi:hydrogenase maturation protease
MIETVVPPRSFPIPGDAEPQRLLILGLGNPMMADDGIGHEVVSRLERCALPEYVRLFAVDGDVLTLTDLWKGEPVVWLVDAVSSNQPVGVLHVYEHLELLKLQPGGLSTHHQNLADVLRWILHARPEMAAVWFRLYGIEAGVVRPGQRLSRVVEAAVTRLVDEIGEASRNLVTSSVASTMRRDENPSQPGDSARQS